tara:strand:+ start:95 stop:856 length:762 start_codon:yes stop_codon:yes gene_type:complete
MDLINNTLGPDYVRDENLNELIKDKKIAYVGPAPNIQGKFMGQHIDSHDIVMRVGDPPVGFLGQTGKEVDYGSRTDILVHSFNVQDRHHLEQDLEWVKERSYLIQPMVRSNETPTQEKWFKHLQTPVHNVPDHHIKSDNHWNKGKPGYLYDYLGSLPNTGFIGILMLLNYDIKHLYITGITFYNMGGWDKKGNCYFDEWYDQLKNQRYGLNESTMHQPQNDIKHFRDILSVKKHRDKIILDEYLMKYFGDLYE